MYSISGTIEGVAPLLQGAFTSAAIKSLDEGTTGGKFTRAERIAEVADRVHRDPDGGIILPKWNFKKCLSLGAAAANLKEGRKGFRQFLDATVFPTADLSFGKTEPDDVLEVVGRRPPKTGPACIVRYPMFHAGWRLDFGLSFVDERRVADHIRRALEEAGLLVGLGPWRPEYGRFVVVDWHVHKP